MKINYTKTYSTLGKVICGCGGAILGFVSSGVLLAIVGAIAGVAVGYVLKKAVLNPSLANQEIES